MPSEEQLSGLLSEFARTMVTDFPIQGILDHLVERIVDIMPVTGAGVTLISPGVSPRYVAASDEMALRFEELQSDLGEGPCLAAYQTGEAVAVPDLRGDTRFPAFGPSASEAGLEAVFTFPLRHGSSQLGALDLYRNSPGPLSRGSMASAQTLADVVSAYLLNAQARSDLQAASDRCREESLRDALTGLPNRALMLERLEHTCLRARRSGRASAVFFVDLDSFKMVNDNHGHLIGDQLLVAVANRLTGLIRPGDTVARMSGDEFVILCEDLGTPDHATAFARRVDAAFRRPFVLSDTNVHITASVGIAFANTHSAPPELLLHHADMAMYQAKRKGGDRHHVLDAADVNDQRPDDDIANLESSLRGASGRGELYAEYQPIVNTLDSRIAGVEALLRWNHPSHGVVPPSTLIPLAERCGLIVEIGHWVLEQAVTAGQRWNGLCLQGDLSMSVNVSGHQLSSAGFVASVAAVVETTRFDPRLLTLEVTESISVGERAIGVLKDLKSIGVKLALDDFGTGNSSLSDIARCPVDIIKIDRSFVAGLGRDPASDSIVGAIVGLAHDLGMTVVAEGVETARQYDLLTILDCDCCQGFYFARPIATGRLDALAHQNNPLTLRSRRSVVEWEPSLNASGQ